LFTNTSSPPLYIDVQEIVIPSPVKSFLAILIAEQWTNSMDQIIALKTGLGLIPAGEDPFWAPVGAATRNMRPKDKIVFLADILPLFGSRSILKLNVIPTLLVEVINYNYIAQHNFICFYTGD
jgi:hypothetical protein